MPTLQAPQAVQRTPFDRWLWEQDIDNATAAADLGVVGETVRRYRLPFGHSGRRTPDPAMVEKIFAYTRGAITPADHYPSKLSVRREPEGAAAS